MEATSEDATNKGRIDIVASTDHTLYLFELKYGKSAYEALNQIHENDYREKYSDQQKNIVLIGINFTDQARNISDYAYEIYDKHGNKTYPVSSSTTSNPKNTRSTKPKPQPQRRSKRQHG